MGAIENSEKIHSALSNVFFPFELVVLLFLSTALYIALRKKLYPSFPANCFVVILCVQLFYGAWLSLFRWMPGSPLKEELGFPASPEACYVVSFVDTVLQMLLVTINTAQMSVIFYTLYLHLVLGQSQKEKLFKLTLAFSIFVALFVSCFVLAEPSRSEMGWCVPGKLGTVVKMNVWVLLLIAQVIMVCACTVSLSSADSMIPEKLRRNAMLRIWGMVASQVLGVFPLVALEFLSVAQFTVPEGMGWWFIIGFPLSGVVDGIFVFVRLYSIRAAAKNGNASVDLLSEGTSHASRILLLSKNKMQQHDEMKKRSGRSSDGMSGMSGRSRGSFAGKGMRMNVAYTAGSGYTAGASADTSITFHVPANVPGVPNGADPELTTRSNSVSLANHAQQFFLGSVQEEEEQYTMIQINALVDVAAADTDDQANVDGKHSSSDAVVGDKQLSLATPSCSIAPSGRRPSAADTDCITSPPAAPPGPPERRRYTLSHEENEMDSDSALGVLNKLVSKSSVTSTTDEEDAFNKRLKEAQGGEDNSEGCYVPISVQMGFSLFLPCALLMGMIIALLVGTQAEYATQQRVSSNVAILHQADLLLTDLSAERAHTATFLQTNGKNVTCNDILGRARRRVDVNVDNFISFVRASVTDVTLISDDHFVLSLAGMIHLDTVRDDIDQLLLSEDEGMDAYTSLMEEFLGIYTTIAREVEGDVYQNALIGLHQLVAGKENAAGARVLGSVAFEEGSWRQKSDYVQFAKLLARERAHESYFAGYSTTSVRDFFLAAVNDTEFRDNLEDMHEALLTADNVTMVDVLSKHYYGNMSVKISLLRDVEAFASDYLVQRAHNALDEGLGDLMVVVGAMFGCLLASGFVILALGNAYGTFKSLEDQAEKVDANANLSILCCLDGCARKVCRMDKLLRLGNFALLLVGIAASVICVVMCSCQLIYLRVQENERIAVVTTHAPLIRAFTDLVHDLQSERNIAALLLSTGDDMGKEFEEHTHASDLQIETVQRMLHMDVYSRSNPIVSNSVPLHELRQILPHLPEQRKLIKKKAISMQDAMYHYSMLNRDVVDFIGGITRAVTEQTYHADMAMTIVLANVRNSMGETQAMGQAEIGHRSPFKKAGSLAAFAQHVATDETHIRVLRSLTPRHALIDLNQLLRSPAYNRSSFMSTHALSKPLSLVSDMNNRKFFQSMETSVKQLSEFQNRVEDRMHQHSVAQKDIRDQMWIIWLVVASLVVLINIIAFDIAIGRVNIFEKLSFWNAVRDRRKKAKNKHKMKTAANKNKSAASKKSTASATSER